MGCNSLRSLGDDIGGCTSLQTLWLRDCTQLESLPGSLWQLDIKQLDLSYCEKLDMNSTVEQIAFNFKNIEALGIAGTNVTVLTEGVGNCTALQALDCSSCWELES